MVTLILRRASSRVSKDEARSVASWFETAQGRLLTMRGNIAHMPAHRRPTADTMLSAGSGYDLGKVRSFEKGRT